MDYECQTTSEALRIPLSAYRPVKRCPLCQSVFITANLCESCGRSMLYHPIGEPFDVKSFYGIKERYLDNLPLFYRLYPVFENKQSSSAKSYVRKISKRFSDLITAFHSLDLILPEQKQLFFLESLELINELLRYGIDAKEIQFLLEGNDNSELGQKLLLYLQQAAHTICIEKSWKKIFLDYRLWGLLRVKYCLIMFVALATVLTVALKYKEIIRNA